MIKVYFDASVIIAALLSPAGGSAKLFEFVKLGAVVGVASQTVIDEVEEHLLKEEVRKILKPIKVVAPKEILLDLAN